jgi:outer membrane protein OmpA-like peptidoglycan-associated protein
MRTPIILLAALIGSAGAACAQVTVDLHALDSLPIGSGVLASPAPYLNGSRPTSRPAGARTPVTLPPVPSQTQAAAPASPAASRPASTQQATAQPQPALPTETPPAADLTPIAPLPPAAEIAPPPPPPVSATAATEAKATTGGLHLTFSAAESDLNPASVDAIKGFAGGDAATSGATFNVLAYAAGSPNDPSAARRLSLSRALAVRSALMADGVASSRIFVRALGSQAGNGPADRVDIDRLGGNSSSAKAQ